MWVVRQSHACSSACFLPMSVSMGFQCVYPYIPHRVVSGASWATTHTRSIVPRLYVVKERKTYPYGMARHGTRIVTAYICALSSSPTTQDSEDVESVYRKAEGGASRMRCNHRVHACTGNSYIVLDEVDWPLVPYYTVDSIGYIGRTWYMRVFLVSHDHSYIHLSGNKAKYLISRVFVKLGQYYSEDRVFALSLRLVFAWMTPQFCIRHGCCTYTRLYVGTADVS